MISSAPRSPALATVVAGRREGRDGAGVVAAVLATVATGSPCLGHHNDRGGRRERD